MTKVMCDSYCSHGGRCEGDYSHAGLHDSGYCTWADEQAYTREQADEVLARTGPGRDYLANYAPLADLVEDLAERLAGGPEV